MRRRIATFNTPIDPRQGGKAGNNDPRNFISGNFAGQQWDIRQFSQDRFALDQAEPPQYSDVHADVPPPEFVVRGVPTRINFIPFFVTTGAINAPSLWVPRNPKRLALICCNQGGDILAISFGPFILSPTAVPLGRPLLAQTNAEYLGETVPINDVYVVDFTTANRSLIAYEGVEALEANP